MSDLHLLQIKIPAEWLEKIQNQTRKQGYVTVSEAVREYLREKFLEEQ